MDIETLQQRLTLLKNLDLDNSEDLNRSEEVFNSSDLFTRLCTIKSYIDCLVEEIDTLINCTAKQNFSLTEDEKLNLEVKECVLPYMFMIVFFKYTNDLKLSR